jgi:hypothetical protein
MTEPPAVLNEGTKDEAHLMGRLIDGRAAYWRLRGDVVLWESGDATVQRVKEELSIEEWVLDREYEERDSPLSGWKTLTPLGDYFRQCAPYRGVGGFDGHRVLPPQQTKAYALRELLNVTRPRTAEVMGISKNTVDNHYRNAQAKIGQILGIASAVNDAREAQSRNRLYD